VLLKPENLVSNTQNQEVDSDIPERKYSIPWLGADVGDFLKEAQHSSSDLPPGKVSLDLSSMFSRSFMENFFETKDTSADNLGENTRNKSED